MTRLQVCYYVNAGAYVTDVKSLLLFQFTKFSDLLCVMKIRFSKLPPTLFCFKVRIIFNALPM